MNAASSSRAKRIITRIQYSSAAVFGVFVVIHVAAPLSAAVSSSPEDAANSVMLLGREIYQTPFLEPIIVWGSLGIHLVSGIIKRLLWFRQPRNQRTWLSRTAKTGWLLVPFVTFHTYTHRLFPSQSIDGKASLSPAYLSYSFVSHTLRNYPLLGWSTYGALLVASSYHIISGTSQILGYYFPGCSWRRNTIRAGQYLSMTGMVLGTARLASSEPSLFTAMKYNDLWKSMFLSAMLR